MAELVYLSCALASVFCAGLLIRNYRRTRLRLALLACLCFSGLALNNMILFVDLFIVPEVDLSLLRNGIAMIAMFLLVFGLIVEER